MKKNFNKINNGLNLKNNVNKLISKILFNKKNSKYLKWLINKEQKILKNKEIFKNLFQDK